MVRKNKEIEKGWQDFIDQEVDIKLTKKSGHEGIAVYVNTTSVGLKIALARLFEAVLTSGHMKIKDIQYCLALACNRLDIDAEKEVKEMQDELK